MEDKRVFRISLTIRELDIHSKLLEYAIQIKDQLVLEDNTPCTSPCTYNNGRDTGESAIKFREALFKKCNEMRKVLYLTYVSNKEKESEENILDFNANSKTLELLVDRETFDWHSEFISFVDGMAEQLRRDEGRKKVDYCAHLCTFNLQLKLKRSKAREYALEGWERGKNELYSLRPPPSFLEKLIEDFD